jgi:hypothetical protein
MNLLPIATRPAPATHRPQSLRVLLALASLLLLVLLLSGCLAEEGLGTGPSGVTWNDVANILWNPSGCGSCHPPVASSGPGTTILDYAPLINNTSAHCNALTQMITIGNSAASCLWLTVTGGGGAGGYDMSFAATPGQQSAIASWIDDGAPGPQ